MFYDESDGAFKILGIFYVERARRDVYEKNRFHTAISYRVEGCSSFYTGSRQLRADTGAVTYIPAGCDYRHTNSQPEKIIILHLQSIGQTSPELTVLPDAMELEPLFRMLLEVWESAEPTAYNRCMALLYRVFEQLQQKKEKSAPPVPGTIAPGLELLQKNFRDPHLTVAALAKACFVSEVYFRRVYRAYSGESPLQTILNLRFRYARNLLRSGYYTAKQAAELSGFSDVKYFRTAFKKRYGETPSEFTANDRKETQRQ